jgi:hypothetical protein
MQNLPQRSDNNNAVASWFGDAFSQLHSDLQVLHCSGGILTGKIRLSFGNGLAKFIGKRLAQKLGIPLQPGEHDLRIEIRHQENSLYWSRCFDQQDTVLSIFRALGNYTAGYWLEETGPVQLKLTVDIVDSAWHWRVLGVRIFGLPMPLVLFPHSRAYKKIIDERYQFHVSFSMPWIGQLFCYEGRLVFEPSFQ